MQNSGRPEDSSQGTAGGAKKQGDLLIHRLCSLKDARFEETR
jgi:hypothetical protein